MYSEILHSYRVTVKAGDVAPGIGYLSSKYKFQRTAILALLCMYKWNVCMYCNRIDSHKTWETNINCPQISCNTL